MEEYKNDSVKFVSFLDKFCQNHHDIIKPGDTLPFRLLSNYVSRDEVYAECIDWSHQFLAVSQCPCLLSAAISHQVAEDVGKWNLTEFLQPQPEDSEKVEEEGDKSSTDTDILDDSDEPERPPPKLEVSRLLPAVLTQVQVVCELWRNSPSLLPAPPPTQHPISVCAIRNTRRKMEDRHVVQPNFNLLFGMENQPSQEFYAVYDGHAGTDAAIYASAHLHYHLSQHPLLQSDPKIALKDVIRQTDQAFLNKAETEKLKSGATAVCALVRKAHLYLAWLGDSQALLVKNGFPVKLMEPHSPQRDDERKRIEDLGGCVLWLGAWRVNGNLSVSRAIGDIDQKPYVSGEPDVMDLPLDGTEDYLILACDGLWDVLNSNDVVSEVAAHLRVTDNDLSSVALKLVKLARDRGSTDNISVVVVFLRENIAGAKAAEKESEAICTEDDAATEGKAESGGERKDKVKDSNVTEEENSDTSPQNRDLGKGESSSDNSNLSSVEPMAVAYRPSQHRSVEQWQESPHDSAHPSPSSVISAAISECSWSYKRPPRPSRSTDLTGTNQNICLSDAPSETSSTDLALLSQTATRCINNRRGKRSKAGRRRAAKDVRRPSKEKLLLSGTIPRPANPPPRSHSMDVARAKSSSFKQSHESISKTGDNLFELLTGFGPAMLRNSTPPGKWTVAVEMENAAAMFND